MTFIQSLIDEGALVLYHDYRKKYFLDLSGNDNHGTPSNVQYTTRGAKFPYSTSRVLVADAPELQLTTGTLICFGDLLTQEDYKRFLEKEDAGGINYRLYQASTPAIGMAAVDTRVASLTTRGKRCIAVGFTSGQVINCYFNGIYVGASGATLTVAKDDAPLSIGNAYFNFTQYANNIFCVVMIVNRQLTATEHAKIYSELCGAVPTKGYASISGVYRAELITNGDFETGDPPTGWTVGNSATASSQSGNVFGGSQVIRVARNGVNNPYVYQNALTVGKTYRVTGWTRSDGNAYPQIYVGSSAYVWRGTQSTSWQYFDVVHTATPFTTVNLQSLTSTGTEYTEWDNVTATEVETNRTDFKTDWGGVADSVTYSAGNYLPGTPFMISSGTWRIVTDTINGEMTKAIECVTTGIIYAPTRLFRTSPTLAAYGTWEFWLNHDTSRWTNVAFVASSTSAIAAADQFGYGFLINSDEAVGIRLLNGATVTQNNISATGYVSAATWLKCKVTRTQLGSISWYINDTLVSTSGGGGANPFTDNTFKTSNYLLLSFGTGDKISLSSLNSDYSIKKMHGIN